MSRQKTAFNRRLETDPVTALPHNFKRIRLNLALAPAFPQGEYVSLRGEDGEMHTYQVMSVTSAT